MSTPTVSNIFLIILLTVSSIFYHSLTVNCIGQLESTCTSNLNCSSFNASCEDGFCVCNTGFYPNLKQSNVCSSLENINVTQKDFTEDSVHLKWTVANLEDDYSEISYQVNITGISTDQIVTNVTKFPSFDVSGLRAAQLYKIDIVTIFNHSYSISRVAQKYVLLRPNIPNVINITHDNGSSVYLEWNSSSPHKIDNATEIIVQVDNKGSTKEFRKPVDYEKLEIGKLEPGSRVNLTVSSFIGRTSDDVNMNSTSAKSKTLYWSLKPSSEFVVNVVPGRNNISLSLSNVTGVTDGFLYELSFSNGTLWKSNRTGNEYMFKDLQPYTPYLLSVQAISNEKTSNPVTKNSTTLEAKPNAPNIISVAPFNESGGVFVNWSRPTMPNGELIAYQVHWNRTLTVDDRDEIRDFSSSTLNLILSVREALPGTNNCFRVRANNSVGYSNWSAEKCRLLSDTRASKPADMTTRVESDKVSISWERPTSPNGVISCYFVLARRRNVYTGDPMKSCEHAVVLESSEGDCRNKLNSSSKALLNNRLSDLCSNATFVRKSQSFNTSASIPLSPGGIYQVTVFAVNQAGPGDQDSKPIMATQRKSSEVEALMTPMIDARSFDVEWKPPLTPNGVILEYVAKVSTIDSVSPVNCFVLVCRNCSNRKDFANMTSDGRKSLEALKNGCNTSTEIIYEEGASSLNVPVNNRRPYTNYSAHVWPVNSVGPGQNQSKTVRTDSDFPDPPREVRVVDGSETSTTFEIEWQIPLNPNGIINGYFVQIPDVQENRTSASDQRYTFTSLESCKMYSFRVKTENNKGNSSFSNASNGVTRVGQPDKPSQPQLYPLSSSSIHVTWTGSTVGNCSIEYEITLKMTNNASVFETRKTSKLSETFGKLQSFSSYIASLSVIAKSDKYGDSKVSEVSVSSPAETKESNPSPVRNLTCQPPKVGEYNQLNCRWDEPRYPNGEIRRYRVIYSVNSMPISNITVVTRSVLLNESIRPETRIEVVVKAETRTGKLGEMSTFDVTLVAGPPKAAISSSELRAFMENSSKNVSVDRPTTQIGFLVPCNVFSDNHGKIKKMVVVVRAASSNAQILPNTVSEGTWTTTDRGLKGPYDALILLCTSDRRRKRSTFQPKAVQRIVIGEKSEGCKGEICNGPLQSGTQYQIAIRAFTNKQSLAIGFAVFSTQKSTPIEIIIPVVVFGILIITGVAAALFVWSRRRTTKKDSSNNRLNSSHNNLISDDNNESMKLHVLSRYPPISELAKQAATGSQTPIPIEIFPAFVQEMNKDCRLLYTDAFNELKLRAVRAEQEKKLTTDEAAQQSNRLKNRFANILPFDHTRVCLSSDDDPTSGMDYINANYISGHRRRREFIACQGPLAQTLDDFWRLIWEQGVSLIVMLTLCVERGRNKCEQYWPQEDETRVYGDIAVRLHSQSILPAYAVRLLDIICGAESRRVTHLQMLTWEDFAAPNVEHLSSFMEAIHSHLPAPGSQGDQAATVVHCSAGVGRTGTLIALDRLTNLIDSGAETIDINGLILSMRRERRHMVQSERQYIFIHEFLLHYLKRRPLTAPKVVTRTPSNGAAPNGSLGQEDAPAFYNDAYRSDPV